MMLSEPQSTPFDLRFRLFGTHVTVTPFFWVMTVVFGWRLTDVSLIGDNGFVALGIWIVAVFISILLHEFGHVWMGRYFRAHDSYIVLHAMGGLAFGASTQYEWWKRVMVYLAGPAIQLVLWAVLYGLARAGLLGALVGSPVALFFYLEMMFINLYWPLLNLLPIWPLDGGQISRELCMRFTDELRGMRISLSISLVVCLALVANALMATRGALEQGLQPFIPYAPTGTFSIIFFALLAFESWQALQVVRGRRSWVDDHREW